MTGGASDFQPDFNIDDVHREQIEIIAGEHGLDAFTATDSEEIRDAWHSLACWPDAPDGLARLRTKSPDRAADPTIGPVTTERDKRFGASA